MANHRSAEKAARQARRRALRNKSVKSAVKSHLRKAEGLIAGGQLTEADAAVLHAIQALDVASRKGVLHPNNVARRKSRLMAKFNVAKAAAAAN